MVLKLSLTHTPTPTVAPHTPGRNSMSGGVYPLHDTDMSCSALTIRYEHNHMHALSIKAARKNQ